MLIFHVLGILTLWDADHSIIFSGNTYDYSLKTPKQSSSTCTHLFYNMKLLGGTHPVSRLKGLKPVVLHLIRVSYSTLQGRLGQDIFYTPPGTCVGK